VTEPKKNKSEPVEGKNEKKKKLKSRGSKYAREDGQEKEKRNQAR